MDLHSKMTMYITSTMTRPVTKTAKTSKWLRLKSLVPTFYYMYKGNYIYFSHHGSGSPGS